MSPLVRRPPRPIRTLLIANRGEIARRIIRTAREMGIRTIAVYSEPDRLAAHVQEADVAVPLGGYAAADSYLNRSALLDAAAWQGADAVHPGYGFLAESAGFAKAVIDAGLTWVGPPPSAIRLMGDKVEAKAAAAEAGVPTLPSATFTGDDHDAWVGQAADVGYPMLIKAAGGGGGKGMRLVHGPDEVIEAVRAGRREATASFGNGMVFAERWLAAARHIEVQVLADDAGHVLHLGTRECSIQRRHQKIIEEAPAPTLDAARRDRMTTAAVGLARAIGYRGAGTVEFLVPEPSVGADAGADAAGDGSGDSTGDGHDFWFLEMNTRLQVEHPVTEAVTGLDLVRLQLSVAEGEDLALAQGDVTIAGHAIEARLYAEDPRRGWLPSVGRLHRWRAGPTPGVRYDEAVVSGASVTPWYDPLLAKVITHAATRDEATARLGRALRELQIHGVTTNRDHLVDLLDAPDFRDGATTTDFVERHPAVADADDPLRYERDWQRFNAVLGPHLAAAALTGPSHHATVQDRWPFAASGWRNVGGWTKEIRPGERTWRVLQTPTGFASQTVTFEHDEQRWDVTYGRVTRDHPLAVRRRAETGEPLASDLFNVTITGPFGSTTTLVELIALDDEVTLVHFGRRGHRCSVHTVGATHYVNSPLGQSTLVELPRFAVHAAAVDAGGPTAPVPGRVVAVEVGEGDEVTVGQTLVVLEAMKVEHRVTASAAGRVVGVEVAVGDNVDAHQVLVRLEEALP